MTKLQGMGPWKKVRRSSKKEINILLAEKYGWEAVECYIQEPLVCDPDDEKCIRQE